MKENNSTKWINTNVNRFHVSGLFLYPLKKNQKTNSKFHFWENDRLSDDFMG